MSWLNAAAVIAQLQRGPATEAKTVFCWWVQTPRSDPAALRAVGFDGPSSRLRGSHGELVGWSDAVSGRASRSSGRLAGVLARYRRRQQPDRMLGTIALEVFRRVRERMNPDWEMTRLSHQYARRVSITLPLMGAIELRVSREGRVHAGRRAPP